LRSVSRVIRSQILKSKELILNEARHMNGFHGSSHETEKYGKRLDKEEKIELRGYIARLTAYILYSFIFFCPVDLY